MDTITYLASFILIRGMVALEKAVAAAPDGTAEFYDAAQALDDYCELLPTWVRNGEYPQFIFA